MSVVGRPVLVAACLLAALLIEGCGDRSLQSPSPDATVVATGDETYFPTHHLTELPMALLGGKLIEQGRCLFGRSRDPRDPGQHLLIWPNDSHVEEFDGILAVRMAEGVLPVGGIFSAGGGEYSDQAFVEKLIGGPIPAECNTPVYWLIGELVSATTG